MAQFCKNCGKSVGPDDNSCIHCGTPLNRESQKKEQSASRVTTPKELMSKKKKRLWQIVAAVAIVLIGFSMWANSYQSPESVQKRFDQALIDKDDAKLAKLMVHEDGSSINKQEAKAFLELVKQEGKNNVQGIYSVASHGKFLFVFEAHKIEAIDQYATYNELIEGLTFEFNGKEVSEYAEDGESIVYGPLAPGIYTVKALYEGEFGETTIEDSMTLFDLYGDYTSIMMDIPVSKVVFYVDNYDQFDLSKSHIELNDEELAISKEGETKEVGPFILDGSQKVKTVVEMPWGEVDSEEISVEFSYMEVSADLITVDQYEGLTGTLKDFGEQYVQAMAKKSTDPFKNISADLKKDLTRYFDDHYVYSGKLEKVEIAKGSMRVDMESETPEIQLLVQYVLKDDFHELKEKAELSDDTITWSIGLSTNKEKEWTITSLESAGMLSEEAITDELEGSKKLYGPSKEAVAKAEEGEFEVDIEQFILDYTEASVEAINYRDFDLVEQYISEDGPRRKEAEEYIEYLDKKDIYQEWYGSELEKVEDVDDTTWKVTVIEEFDIQRPDGSEIKKFRTTVIVKQKDNEFYVDELIETNEI